MIERVQCQLIQNQFMKLVAYLVLTSTMNKHMYIPELIPLFNSDPAT